MYCSAKVENIVIAYRRCGENLHENPDKGHGGEGTGRGQGAKCVVLDQVGEGVREKEASRPTQRFQT